MGLRTVSTLGETDRSPGCHNSEITSLQESLDLWVSELLDEGQLVPGKLSGPLLSCSCQKFCKEPEHTSDAAETHRDCLSSPCSIPLPPTSAYFRDPVLGSLIGRGQRVHQSSHVLGRSLRLDLSLLRISPLFFPS